MRDLIYAWRGLRRAPGFAAVAIITLALGIGVNTVIFSIAAPMLLEALPYPAAQRIVEVSHEAHGEFQNGLNGSEALYLEAHQRTLASVAIVEEGGDSNLRGAGNAVRVNAIGTTHGYFDVWGVEPVRGRDFLAADDEPGGARVAILSYGLWQKQFGGDANVLGRTFRLNGEVYTAIGVMPARFVTLTQNQLNPEPAQLWVDMQPTEASLAPQGPNLDVIGRLAAGMKLAQAQANLTALKLSFQQTHPQVAPKMDWGVQSMHDAVASGNTQPLWLLLGAVGLVLLIACANLANLLLARATGRTREMAIRAAIGANRGRIVRQLLTESGLLAALGAVLGWLLAWWSVPLLVRLMPAAYLMPSSGLNGTVLLFTIGVTVIAAILFGLAPALHASRTGLQASLKDSVATSGGISAGRARAALIVGEVALAFLLLAGAGLLLASLAALGRVNPGFELRDVMTAQTSLAGQLVTNDAATTRYTQAVLEKLRRLPGVAGAASITGVPLTRSLNETIDVPGHANDPRRYDVEWRGISPGYFRTLQIALLRGRDFRKADTGSSQNVAIVSANVARHFWPRETGLGEVVDGAQVVGIAADVHENGVDQPAPYTVYFPQAQVPDNMNKLANHWFAMGFVIRGNGADLGARVREAFASVNPDQPVFAVQSLEQLKGTSLNQYSFMGTLLGVFAGLALILGGVGIYGVLAYAVAQQRREIGIRMALGADRRRILGQYLGYGMKLAAMGLAIGVVASLWLMKLLGSFLFGVSPADPWVLAAVAIALLVIAWLASLRPAWVATRVDPLQALRPE